MMKSAIEVFGEWAKTGGDERMAQGHLRAVDNMLGAVLGSMPKSFTAIDAGCGNGWVVRRLRAAEHCGSAQGIDGAAEMIARARELDPSGDYVHADLLAWRPNEPVDLVHSMEVFYYVRDPADLIRRVTQHWMKPGGRLIIGVDHYQENTPSLNWAEKTGVSFMTTLTEAQWLKGFVDAGLTDIDTWRVDQKGDWAGTLVLTGVKGPSK
jgi:trans-aconitate methyltransferase